MSMSTRVQRITEAIKSKLNPLSLIIHDDSHKHAGHAAMRGSTQQDATHLRIEVVSDAFEGKSLIARHRLVQDICRDELASGLHALQLSTKTPKEVEASKSE